MESRKITPEEAKNLNVVSFGRKHPIRALLETLEPGELARISRKDFNWRKRTPNFFLKQLTAATGRKFTIKKELGKTGWLVERVE